MNIESNKKSFDKKSNLIQNKNLSYQSPLITRYASSQMSHLFSDQVKFSTWRTIWYTLAQAQQLLGLSITNDQLDQLKDHIHLINFEAAYTYEKKLRHDVMAHVHAYADQCPDAKSIIHLGATSCMITDNADLIIFRDAMHLIKSKLLSLISELAYLADRYKNLACLSFTHMQPAQPTTIGKRIACWLQDFLIDFHDLSYRIESLRFLGIKGATGTQATFLELFSGNHEKVKQLENLIAQKLNFTNILSVTGQTYTRKQDVHILQTLSGIAQSAHKMANDIRLLSYMKEVEEPFETEQIGSSAMPYKRNPMRSERVCSLARYAINLSHNPEQTASTQWFERTLDDSANRRLCIPESFLAIDAVLNLLSNVSSGLLIHPKIIENNLMQELPFMATEAILMQCVKKGGNRQVLHERLRQHSMEVSYAIKHTGAENNLIKLITDDPEISLNKDELALLLDTKKFIGRAPEQVSEFLENEVYPMLKGEEVDFKNITINC